MDNAERLRLIEGISTEELALWIKEKKRDSITRQKIAAKDTRIEGSIYSQSWLETVQPLASKHMGVENMGPLLYSLVRFLKPQRLLEVGAGYTTVYLLQALADNERELLQVAKSLDESLEHEKLQGCSESESDSTQWYLGSAMKQRKSGSYIISIDNEEHGVFTSDMGGMSGVSRIVNDLGLSDFFRPVKADAFEVDLKDLLHTCTRTAASSTGSRPLPFDFVWLDGITTDDRWDRFFLQVWQGLCGKSGHVLVHSTLTNTRTRTWLSLVQQQLSQTCSFEFTLDFKPIGLSIDMEKMEEILRTSQLCTLPDGWAWLDGSDVIYIGFGLKKLRMRIRVQQSQENMSEETAEQVLLDWTDALISQPKDSILTENPIQSIDIVTDVDGESGLHSSTNNGAKESRVSGTILGLLEPHKRYQNSVSIFQKRNGSWAEPIFSWGP